MTQQPCRIVGCVCLASPTAPHWPRQVDTHNLCLTHQQMSDDDLKPLLARKAGMVAQLEPVTDRIVYEKAKA